MAPWASVEFEGAQWLPKSWMDGEEQIMDGSTTAQGPATDSQSNGAMLNLGNRPDGDGNSAVNGNTASQKNMPGDGNRAGNGNTASQKNMPGNGNSSEGEENNASHEKRTARRNNLGSDNNSGNVFGNSTSQGNSLGLGNSLGSSSGVENHSRVGNSPVSGNILGEGDGKCANILASKNSTEEVRKKTWNNIGSWSRNSKEITFASLDLVPGIGSSLSIGNNSRDILRADFDHIPGLENSPDTDNSEFWNNRSGKRNSLGLGNSLGITSDSGSSEGLENKEGPESRIRPPCRSLGGNNERAGRNNRMCKVNSQGWDKNTGFRNRPRHGQENAGCNSRIGFNRRVSPGSWKPIQGRYRRQKHLAANNSFHNKPEKISLSSKQYGCPPQQANCPPQQPDCPPRQAWFKSQLNKSLPQKVTPIGQEHTGTGRPPQNGFPPEEYQPWSQLGNYHQQEINCMQINNFCLQQGQKDSVWNIPSQYHQLWPAPDGNPLQHGRTHVLHDKCFFMHGICHQRQDSCPSGQDQLWPLPLRGDSQHWPAVANRNPFGDHCRMDIEEVL